MFRFTFFGNEITLTGWAPDKKNDNNDNYDQIDILSLKTTGELVSIDSKKIYLGNIRLKRNDVKAIYMDLQENLDANFVIFKPIKYPLDETNIAYEVYISETRSSTKIISTGVTAKSADPSPPATRK